MSKDKGKGKGKGGKVISDSNLRAGKGKLGTKRKKQKHITHLSRGDIRRLAKRGGCQRISTTIYPEFTSSLRDFLSKIVQDCIVYSESAKRKTVTQLDVMRSVGRKGYPLYM